MVELNSPTMVNSAFVKGAVAGCCLGAFQNPPHSAHQVQRVLRLSLQGGTAIWAGEKAAAAYQRADYAGIAKALLAGSVGVVLLEALLQEKKI